MRIPLGAPEPEQPVSSAAPSLVPLVLTTAACSTLLTLYALVGVTPNGLAALGLTLAPLVAALTWMRADARHRGLGLVHDIGLFLVVAWPILIPWYTVRSRGRHSWPFAAVILFLIAAPQLIAAVVGALHRLPR